MNVTLGVLLIALIAVWTNAQQVTPSAQSSTSAETPQDLAKATLNPFADIVKLPLLFTTAFDLGEHHNAGEAMNVQPLVPFPLAGC